MKGQNKKSKKKIHQNRKNNKVNKVNNERINCTSNKAQISNNLPDFVKNIVWKDKFKIFFTWKKIPWRNILGISILWKNISGINVSWGKISWRKISWKNISWKSPRVIGGSVILILVISGSAYYLSTTTAAAAVMINGQQIGLVRNTAAGQDMLAGILKEKGQAFGITAQTHDQVTYKDVRVDQATYLKSAISEQDLENKLSFYLAVYALEVDGTQVAVLPSQADADKVLKDYQDYYVKPSANNQVTSVSMSEKVDTKEIEVKPDQIQQPDQVLKMLIAGKTTSKDYTVQPNDSWWLIARKNDMLTNEVLAGNPGDTPTTKLHPGQVIKLVSNTPYLTVVSEGTLTDTETIPYDTITKKDYSLGSGQSKVIQQGKEGSEIVTYSYVQKNGKDVSEEVISQKVIQSSVNKVVAQGPSSVPINVAFNTSRGSGQISGIAWPLQGSITSRFGYRPEFGDFHTGVDISGHIGTPYYAAAAGTVVSAGWDGGYGNMILIDHGNGIATRYAHSSKLLVKVGQHVSQGQEIGLVGNTGNVTGPHLHFEVIVNGEPMNPLNYLP